MSFQEYGFLVSTVEIVIKQKESKTSKDNNQLLQYFLPFYELCAVKKSDTSLSVYYMDGITESIKNLKEADLEALHQIIKFAIDSGYTKVNLFDELVSEEEIQLDESLEIIEEEAISEMELDDYKNLVRLRFTDENRQSRLDKTIDNQIKSMDIKSINRAASTAAGVNLVDGLRQEITNNQMFDRFGGGQGHGHVGEQAGTVLDRFLDKRAVALGSSHTKNGADRLVNGVNIQTKYSRTPGKTIGQAFTNEGARYLNPNGSMMVIEVPRDQYNQGVKLMGQKIKEGKVPNETNPANAKRYVKKGALTYEQAQIATHSIFERKSTITTTDGSTRTVSFTEKMIYSAGGDFLTGASIAIPTSIVTSVWVFCTNRWQGVDEKLAVKNALKSGIRPMLMAGTVYMFSSQFAGVQINNLAKRQVISAAEKVQIKNEIAQRHFGRGMTVLMVATAVGPDVIDVLRGRISVKKKKKNAVVTASGISVGAAIGGALGSVVPIIGTAVGTVLGGTAGSYISKKILDKFVEDDAVLMIMIAREEFIETVMVVGLSQEEFRNILKKTFMHSKINKTLKDMFASGEPRTYIHNLFLELVIDTYKQRELPSETELLKVMALSY